MTYGCQMNEHDSEIMAGLLESRGYQAAEKLEDADVILVNTCSVRESAENKVYGRLGQLKELKKKNPNLVIGVTGCLAQEKRTADKIKKQAPHVDLLFGTHNIHRLPELLDMAQESNGTLVEVWEHEGEIVEGLSYRRIEGLKAFVTIMYGCNNYCSYCIVPYVRGRQRSRYPEHIIAEVRDLAAEGYKEVTLLGQNVNAYGLDLDINWDFADLLKVLDDVGGIERIRYTTSHPRDFSDKMIKVIAESRSVCEHFHLPVQAGSNEVLRRMNRGYTREDYFRLIDKIREAIPAASITTDIIVGFPGETEEQFEETLSLVERVQFDNAFTFMYSPRRGTAAAKMPDQLPREVKQKRLERLMAVQNEISLRKNESIVGQEVEVLVEGWSEKNKKKLTGRTRTNKVVIFDGDENLIGKLLNVKIAKAHAFTLYGTLEA